VHSIIKNLNNFLHLKFLLKKLIYYLFSPVKPSEIIRILTFQEKISVQCLENFQWKYKTRDLARVLLQDLVEKFKIIKIIQM